MAEADGAAREQTIKVVISVDPALMAVLDRLAGITRPPAVRAVLSIGARMPPVTITVDTVNEIATIAFVDDKGNTNAPAPAGAIALFTSDNTAALTIANDTANPFQGDITVEGEGVANVGVTLTDANGSLLVEADGVTPWPAIPSVAVTVDPGAAVGAQLSVS